MPKQLSTRERSLNTVSPPAYTIVTTDAAGKNPFPGFSKEPHPGQVGVGRQITVSEGHEPSKDGNYREGGPFYTARMEQHIGHTDDVTLVGKISSTAYRKYVGPLIISPPPLNISESALKSIRSQDTSDLDPYGTIAIAQCAPTNPIATVSTGLAEVFREGIPTLPGVQSWKRRVEALRAVGSEFLNYEFGWLPLKNEIEQVSEAVRHHRTIIQQYERDANRQVRREFAFPVEHSVTETSAPGRAGFPSYSTGTFDSGTAATITTRQEVTRRKWFSGAFVHPPLDKSDFFSSVFDAGTEADKLFGITLTPDVLWELTPWSWAIDWFTNTGAVIHNLTAMSQYGLIMRYGYMMEEKTIKTTNSIDRAALIGQENRSVPDSWSRVVTKVRRPANPFGFGITASKLSPTQVAILAAVGITLL